MRHKTLILSFLIASLPFFAQTKSIIPIELKWKGVEQWSMDSLHLDVIAFENAHYPSAETLLPSFFYETAIEPNDSYKIEVENINYIEPSEAELEILRDKQIPEEIKVTAHTSRTRGKLSLEIDVFPFVKKENKILKTSDFRLVLSFEKSATTRRKASIRQAKKRNNSSVLRQGRFIKLRVTESGVHKITYEALNAKGIDPKDLRIFGYGGALLNEDFSKYNPDDLPEVALYDTGKEILFYAQGTTSWHYDPAIDMFTHTTNCYSRHGYYFITDSEVGEKKRISEQSAVNKENAVAISEFTDYRLHERDLVNLANSGREFYGEKFSATNTQQNFDFNFENRIKEKPILVNLDAAATNTSRFILTLSGEQKTLNIPAISGSPYELAKTAKEKFSFSTNNSDKLSFRLRYSASTGIYSGYLNFIEVNAQRYLTMQGNEMPFHNKKNIGASSVNLYRLAASGDTQIWDITNPNEVSKMPTNKEGSHLLFSDSATQVKSYLAINLDFASNIKSAELLDEIPNQNIHGWPAIDMLIITHPFFREQAQKLADAHHQKDGLRVGVVTTEQVYNEFSSGTPDATAYRKAAKFFYDNAAEEDKLKYLLLFGKGSFDNRCILPETSNQLILTYQSNNSVDQIKSFITDDYFALLEDNKGLNVSQEKMDIGVGRFPATTTEEAEIMVKKTIDYMNGGEPNLLQDKDKKPEKMWKNNLCFIGDDGDYSEHMKQANSLANSVAEDHPDYKIKKILLDAYQQERNASGESYPIVKNEIKNLLHSGLLLITYIGHSGTTELSNEKILTTEDIKEMKNKHLPLFISGSCSFSYFDRKLRSGGEELLLTPQGGAVATFSAARIVLSGQNFSLLQHFFKKLFKKENGAHYRVGDVVRMAKNEQGPEINKMSFIYLGDPALKLKYPTDYDVKTIQINEKKLTEEKDTLQALSVATIKGKITKNGGTPAKDFNGYLHTTVYDKEEKITTLNNDNITNGEFTFQDYPNVIFTGKSKIVNGEFEFSFMVPKNIRYGYGPGRIVYSAWNETDKGGQGYCEDFIIGGSNKEAEEDTSGPDVEIYLNHKSFKIDSNVNETPLFVATIFDKSGINISGTGIGQDALLVIDDKKNERYVLNSYFVADEDSYQKGKIYFSIPKLSEGRHTLKFKIWDTQNNSTTKELSFNVVNGLVPDFLKTINYPNPATDHTYFVLDYRSEEIIRERVNVDIFDMTGRLIWRTEQLLDNNRIYWDLLNANGHKIPPGIYLYRLSVKKGKVMISSKANKLIVK